MFLYLYLLRSNVAEGACTSLATFTSSPVTFMWPRTFNTQVKYSESLSDQPLCHKNVIIKVWKRAGRHTKVTTRRLLRKVTNLPKRSQILCNISYSVWCMKPTFAAYRCEQTREIQKFPKVCVCSACAFTHGIPPIILSFRAAGANVSSRCNTLFRSDIRFMNSCWRRTGLLPARARAHWMLDLSVKTRAGASELLLLWACGGNRAWSDSYY